VMPQGKGGEIPSGLPYSGAVRDPEETCRSFVQVWAEAVMRQVERVREVRKKAHSMGRAYERGFGPDEIDLARCFREQWAEEQTLVWAAHQVERWARRLAEEWCEEPPRRDEVLAWAKASGFPHRWLIVT
jgi:hypothetical protein